MTDNSTPLERLRFWQPDRDRLPNGRLCRDDYASLSSAVFAAVREAIAGANHVLSEVESRQARIQAWCAIATGLGLGVGLADGILAHLGVKRSARSRILAATLRNGNESARAALGKSKQETSTTARPSRSRPLSRRGERGRKRGRKKNRRKRASRAR